MEKMLFSGVQSNSEVALIAIKGIKNQPGIAAKVFGAIAEEKINVELILQSIGRGENKDISFVVAQDEADHAVETLKKAFDEADYEDIISDKEVGIVSIVGAGMMSNSGAASKMFEALYNRGIRQSNDHKNKTQYTRHNIILHKYIKEKTMFDFSEVKNYDPELAEAMENELTRQRTNLELIASENLVSKAVMAAMGSHLTNKYAEGYPGKRYYGGCQYVDVVEDLARERAKELFGCEYVNVQPHSGAQANMAVFFAVLNVGDTYMGMSLDHGGHLTHGSPVNMSGKNYHCVPYGVNDEGFIDYDEVERIALECKPKMIIAGASAYARAIDFKRFREIADKVGAVLMVDMAHIAGLVAAGLHQSPIPYAHVTTTTTHKTLRGPRGGMIMCSNEVNEKYNFNKAIFPGIQGGPLMHVIAGKAVAFKEALDPSFKEYMTQVVKNADTLANALIEEGFDIVSGGTDNHLMLVDLKKYDLTGKEAEKVLDSVHITCNKNTVPNDPKSPFVTSGLRLGTPAVTTRGLKEDDMKVIAKAIRLTLLDKKLDEANELVLGLTEKYPLYE